MRRLILTCIAVTVSCIASAQDWAKPRLEKSPRHLEWVKIKHGTRELNCFVGYPELKDKATAIIVIHEIFGLSDWARSVVDEFAEAGYLVIAPDLLSGSAPGGGGTAELGSGDAVRKAISTLPPEQVTADLMATAEFVSKLPACNGKVVVGGFCWGGSETFRFATNNKEVRSAFVFYGIGPGKEEDLKRIECPVYGFYAGNDARVTSTVSKTSELMKQLGKTYEPIIYEGAGHGFMRASGEQPGAEPANKKARDEAWERLKQLLKKVQ